MTMKKLWLLILLLLSVVSCTHSGRYQLKRDALPSTLSDSVQLDDAKPRYESIYEPSLRPYKVLGKHYTPLKSATGYNKVGVASWYGKKFHGHKTANGEIYDINKMTAAHKYIPLPTYVKVTNLSNQRRVIVRVNDRGPFHDDREIDLSYAAALKLGMLQQGLTRVRVEAISLDAAGRIVQIGSRNVNQQTEDRRFIQVAALSNQQNSALMAASMERTHKVKSIVVNTNGLYRVLLGPIDNDRILLILDTLRKTGYQSAFLTDHSY
jgi:rare lipoprotein A